MTPNETAAESEAFKAWVESLSPREKEYGFMSARAGFTAGWNARAASPVTPQKDQAVASPAVSAAEGETDALRLFMGAAVPCVKSIDPRGYQWCEAYLDEALAEAKMQHILTCSESELDAMIRAEGGDPADYARRGRQALDRAIAQVDARAATPSPRDCDSPASVESALVVAARRLTDCLHMPNPTDPNHWCVAPHRGRDFSAAVSALLRLTGEV
jgi:hypothetical protein